VREHFVPRVVVCCRANEYEAIGVRLALAAAVMVKPLAPSEVERLTTQPDERLRTIGMLLQTDEHLRDLATSPLLLSLINSIPIEILRDGLRTESPESARRLRDRIVRLYVDHVSQQQAGADGVLPLTTARSLRGLPGKRRTTVEATSISIAFNPHGYRIILTAGSTWR
jgi:hypothetical protein